MGGFFNPDNAFFRTMSKIWDMIVVSIIWTVLCIPMYFAITMVTSEMTSLVQFLLYAVIAAVCMIPAGPAMASIYYVNVKVIRRERGYAIREFFHAFKMNFKQGALLGAILGMIVTLLSFDYQYAYKLVEAEETMGTVILIGSLSITLILIGILMVIFPVLSRFSMTTKQLVKTSMYIAFRHLLTTLILLVIVVATAIGLYLILPAVLLLPSLCALVCSFPMERVLKKYMPKPENTVAADGDHISEGSVVAENEEGEKEDLWYLE
ncbi:MAG: DUF624 domain-containing protein [Lachnospiraceae bacterium]|nr:DUF624 domain-containing protein [Lachnospiraceae bacterium]